MEGFVFPPPPEISYHDKHR